VHASGRQPDCQSGVAVVELEPSERPPSEVEGRAGDRFFADRQAALVHEQPSLCQEADLGFVDAVRAPEEVRMKADAEGGEARASVCRPTSDLEPPPPSV